MKIQGNENNRYLLIEMGNRIRDTRIASNMTRKELAEKAGVALKTMERVENGENVKIENLLNILRALKLLQNLEILIPEQSDLTVFDKPKKRKRASGKRKKEQDTEWKWGDEL